MKVLIIGSSGQLGSDLVEVLSKEQEVIPTYRNEGKEKLDISKYDEVERVLAYHMPDIVINTSAFHNVDLCETEEGKKNAFSINVDAVMNLARVCDRIGCAFVHISTDYVFDGNKGKVYEESDLPNPINVYGKSKLEGEKAVQNIAKHFVIRTSYLYGKAGKREGKTNLVETLLKFGRKGEINAVFDNKISPTYTRDLAEKIAQLIKTSNYGTYHITNSGECSVEEFAREIFKIAGISPNIKRVTHEEFSSAPGRAPRPLYSPLTSINLKKAGLSAMRPWHEALGDYLKGEKMSNETELKTNLDTQKKIEPNNKKLIKGVELVQRKTNSDDRGYLTEIYRVDEPYHYGGPLKQVYIVENDVRGTIRAFHKHKELWDFFSISKGSAKFILIDDRPESETFGAMNVFVLNEKNKSLLIVPPGVFHGWMSLKDDTQMVSIASHTYNYEKPDEVRIPPHSFGSEWEVKGR